VKVVAIAACAISGRDTLCIGRYSSNDLWYVFARDFDLVAENYYFLSHVADTSSIMTSRDAKFFARLKA